jgi:type IV pilus assembly protein PilM
MSVGLDIGSKTVKIVELSKDRSKWNLRSSGIVGYSGVPPEKVKDDKELAPLAGVIKKLHKEAKISTKEVTIALPETQVYTRPIKFPLLTDSEIASAVRWEAEQYIPIPLEEAIVQHQVLERKEDVTPAEVLVLLVAAPRNVVEKYQRLVELSGLTLIAAETELVALTRSLAPKEETVLIADFGARSTNLAIAKNGKLSFSRSIATGGDAFTRAIAQGLGIDRQQAEEYKRIYGLSSKHLEGKVKGALDTIFRLVADEMRKAIQFYQSEEQGDSPNFLILSGGAAGMPDSVSVLTKLLGLEVAIGNPFRNIVVDQEAAKSLSGYTPLYSISVGLALRGD